MKKTLATVLLSGFLALTLSGCGSGPNSPWAGNSGSSESILCTDDAVLAQLKNDETPEFVLDGHYYTLPARLGEFTENGWAMTIDDYEGQEVILQPNERVDITLTKDDNRLYAELANDSAEPLEAGDDCNVIKVSIFTSKEDAVPSLFVTKYGITTATSAEHVRELLHDKSGFRESSDLLYLTFESDQGTRDVLLFSEMEGYTSIDVESSDGFRYRRYRPLEEKAAEQAEKIAQYKADAEAGCPSDYNEIIKLLDTKAMVPFYSVEGTVLLKSVGNYEGTEGDLLRGGDLSLYVVQDASGQPYCIYEGYADYESTLELPELAEGDVISLWGFASKVTKFEDGVEVPTVIAKIIEKDGEVLYLADELQVK